MRRYSTGFSVIEVLIIAGVVVLLGGLGFVGWRAFNKSAQTAATTSQSPAKQSAEVITTKADLEKAEKALGDLNFDDDSATQAESQAEL